MGKEVNNGDGEGLFAATPPLEALRLLLSEGGTMDEKSIKEDKVIMIKEMAMAFFEAPVKKIYLCRTTRRGIE